jgi:uncharacterized LabA/DUF88 family protein
MHTHAGHAGPIARHHQMVSAQWPSGTSGDNYPARRNAARLLDRIFRAGERTFVMIDGANISRSLRRMSFRMDFEAFKNEIESRCNLFRIGYFVSLVNQSDLDTKIPEERRINFKRVRSFVQVLGRLGYTIYSRETRVISARSEDDDQVIKGNVDVLLTCAAMDETTHVDHVVLMTGDGDFVEVVNRLKAKGKRVTVIATSWRGENGAASTSCDLRAAADAYLDLEDIFPLMQRGGE